jgi:hypothetical protein
MDRWALKYYMSELERQVKAGRLAVDAFNQARQSEESDAPLRLFAAGQALLGNAAMISKLLWRSGEDRNPDGSPLSAEQERVRQFGLDRAKTLRRELKIKAPSILERRDVRNGFEHFDDRLDAFLASGGSKIVDFNVGPRAAYVVGGQPAQHLRFIDNHTLTISVLEKEVALQELWDAMATVGQKVHDWLTKNAASDGASASW